MLSFGISITSSLGLSIVPTHASWILNLEVTESSMDLWAVFCTHAGCIGFSSLIPTFKWTKMSGTLSDT